MIMWRFFLWPPPSKMCDFTELQNIIKFDLKVKEQWSERFWKADDPYFQKILIASTNFSFFIPFWNQNGIYWILGEILDVTSKYRSGSKKTQNWKKNLEMWRRSHKLSNAVPTMWLRRLDHFLDLYKVW